MGATTKRSKKSTTKKPTKKKAISTKHRATKHADGNPYRPGSFYAACWDSLARLSSKKPVSRKELLTAYCKASGKDEKHGRYDLAVVLSPTKDGDGHRSSRKDAYYVERLENGMVRLHMAG